MYMYVYPLSQLATRDHATHCHSVQEPGRVGFRSVIVSPTRELAQQTYRECVRLSAGSGFKVHVLTKAKATANSFGPQSSQRFGEQSASGVHLLSYPLGHGIPTSVC